MNLLVFSDRLLMRNGKRYFTRDPFNRFPYQFLQWFDKVTLAARVLRAEDPLESLIELPLGEGSQLEILETAYWENLLKFYTRFPLVMLKNLSRTLRVVRQSDLVAVLIPAPNSSLVAILATVCGKPYFCFCAGDQELIVRKGTKYRGPLGVLAKTVASFNARVDRYIVGRSASTFFWSSELAQKLGECCENFEVMFATSFRNEDIPAALGDTLPPPPFRLIYSGRLSHEKGLDHAVEAAQRLAAEGNRFRLDVCGEGPERQRLELKVRDAALSVQVRFAGHIKWGPELFSRYRNSHALLLPSISEGQPRVLLEAMACGCPVIATRVGGIPDIVTHMENGILIESGSAQAIVDAVKLLASDEELRRLLAENGRRFAMEHTAEKQAEKMALVMLKHCGDGKSTEPRA